MNLHILGPGFSTFVRSVRIYCEEKRLTYTYGMTLNEEPISWGSEALREYHPFGKVPVLIHDDAHVFETLAICKYLDAVFPNRTAIAPLADHIRIEQWSSALITCVDTTLVRNYILPIAGPNRATTFNPQKLEAARLAAKRILAILDEQLESGPYLCGRHWSVADALLTPMLDYLASTGEHASLLDELRHLPDYLERMRTRPSACVVLQ